MNPAKVVRHRVKVLSDLPNVGPAVERDLHSLGIHAPNQLRGKDPLALYRALCKKSGQRQDPCVLDVFISLTRFANGEPPKAWWAYTSERKETYGEL